MPSAKRRSCGLLAAESRAGAETATETMPAPSAKRDRSSAHSPAANSAPRPPSRLMARPAKHMRKAPTRSPKSPKNSAAETPIRLTIDEIQPAATSDRPNSPRSCAMAIGTLPTLIATATPQKAAASTARQSVRGREAFKREAAIVGQANILPCQARRRVAQDERG
jgi:hypothetical protein